ncbi:hypothetical protein JB92DRAFT_2903580 [Gautieria morchelliformis]|nr:hypothetical protein JB92DRAFT_2903580 [Gautieria morchelliformis]
MNIYRTPLWPVFHVFQFISFCHIHCVIIVNSSVCESYNLCGGFFFSLYDLLSYSLVACSFSFFI